MIKLAMLEALETMESFTSMDAQETLLGTSGLEFMMCSYTINLISDLTDLSNGKAAEFESNYITVDYPEQQA